MFNRIPWRDALRIAITVIAVVFGVQLCPEKSSRSCSCSCHPPTSPPCDPPAPPTPPAPKQPTPDPWNAVARIATSQGYCSGTFIGPRLSDGRWLFVTAAHCVRGQGDRIEIRLRDGRNTGAKIVSWDATADCAWAITDDAGQEYPFALLADAQPSPGTPIFHCGYGIHIPGNREEGTVGPGPGLPGKMHMHLSVSNGDSGGGIFEVNTGRLVSCVCCSRGKGTMADVYGAQIGRVKAIQPTALRAEPLYPVPLPSIVAGPVWRPGQVAY